MNPDQAIGSLLFLVGMVLVVTRVNPLQFGAYRFDYVTLHVSLAAACMYSGMVLLTGVMQMNFLHISILCSSLCHISYTGGLHWTPSEYMRTEKSRTGSPL